MKALVTIFIITSFLLVLAVDTEIPHDLYKKYNQSYNHWQHVKKLWHNSYQYTSGTSSWTGYSTSTTIFILNGEVVGREYTASYNGQQREHWFENKDQLNSHDPNTGAMQTRTLDNIYATCLESLNVSTFNDHIKYQLVFEVDTANQGLLKSCGNIPHGCADDCFFGVSIYNLKPYKQQQSSSSTVSMTSTTKNLIDDGKLKEINNDGNLSICSNFLLFLNIFIVKAMVCAYLY